MDENRQRVNTWLERIGQQRNLALSLDEKGHASLICSDNLTVLIEVPDNSDLFFFYSPLLLLPYDIHEQNSIMKKALALNNFSLETGGASIGYDDRNATLLLTFAERPALLNDDTFAECLGKFIEMAMEIKSKI